MNLKSLSNSLLHEQTKQLAEKERSITVEVIRHIREVERRMLYAEMGYKDLKMYCVKELKYSEGSAWRRINAMKLIVDVPEVENKIQSGDLNLTQAVMARTVFRDIKPTVDAKKEILLSLENQSQKSSEKILAEHRPEIPIPKESERHLRGGNLAVTLVLDSELQQTLNEIEILLGKPTSKLELLKVMAKEKLEKLRKEKLGVEKVGVEKSKVENLKVEKSRIERSEIEKSQSTAQPSDGCATRNYQGSRSSQGSRYISRLTFREVNHQSEMRCQFRDHKTGRQCEARMNLQIDHIHPLAKGGTNSPENLRLLCSTHNKFEALKHFGAKKMQAYLPSLR